MRIPSGTTDQYIYFVAVDATDGYTRETGLTGFTVYRSRNGAAAAAMTTPTVNEVDATNMPGVYELLLDEDMTIGAGNDSEAMVFHITQASMRAVTVEIELYRPKITAGYTLGVGSDGDLLEVNTLTGHTVQTGDSYARIGAAGAGLTAVPWNASWDAEVQSEVADGLTAFWTSPATLVDLIWDEATAGHVTAGSTGVALTDILADTDELQTNQGDWATATGFSTHSAADVWTVTTRVLTANTNLNDPTAATIADAVWDELQSGHVTAGSFGEIATEIAEVLTDTGTTLPASLAAIETDTQDIQTRLPAALVSGRMDSDVGNIQTDAVDADALAADAATEIANAVAEPTAAAIADAVLDELLSGHTTPGSLGQAITDILADTGTTLNDKIDTLDTLIDAIKAKTDSLTFSQTGQVDANIKRVADTTVTGAGTEGDPWGP